MSKSRLETFSDGVFAIAITLLVLTIAQPNDYQHLARQLADRSPALAAYAVSFLVIGIMSLNHASIGIALINAYLCLAVHALLAVYYALDPLSRRAAMS